MLAKGFGHHRFQQGFFPGKLELCDHILLSRMDSGLLIANNGKKLDDISFPHSSFGNIINTMRMMMSI